MVGGKLYVLLDGKGPVLSYKTLSWAESLGEGRPEQRRPLHLARLTLNPRHPLKNFQKLNETQKTSSTSAVAIEISSPECGEQILL